LSEIDAEQANQSYHHQVNGEQDHADVLGAVHDVSLVLSGCVNDPHILVLSPAFSMG
jgi:hypothetical protein